MKLYSIEGKRRYVLIISFVAFAIALILALHTLVQNITFLKELFEIKESWVSTFQVASLFLFSIVLPPLYWLFDRIIWKLPYFNSFFGVPNLNGVWIGTLDRTEYPMQQKESGLPIFIKIKQTYFKILIEVKNIDENSLSGITASKLSAVGLEGEFGSEMRLNTMFESVLGDWYGANTLIYNDDAGDKSLQGDYVSSYPRVGKLCVKKIPNKQNLNLGKIKQLKSKENEIYYGITIEAQLNTKHRKKLIRRIGAAEFSTLTKNRQDRDGQGYHITIITPPEMEKLNDKQLDILNNQPEISFVIEQLGHVQRDGADSYFITVTSLDANYIRAKLGLPKKDFHITLGFSPHDIHEIPKDKTKWVA